MKERAEKIAEYRCRQPIEVLKKKAQKARRQRGKLWTTEEIDYAKAEGTRLRKFLFGE